MSRSRTRHPQSREQLWRQLRSAAGDAWITCPACGKRSYFTRRAAERAGARLPDATHSYRCGGYWHVTTEPACTTAYRRDALAEGVRVLGGIPQAEFELIDPEVYDLRAAGWSMYSIAEELGVSQFVVATILRQHDPLAVPDRRAE